MALKVIIDSLDDVDEALRGLYKKSGDKFMLDVTNIDNHPTVSGLSKTMKDERDARKKFEKSLKELEKKTKGVDLDALKDFDLEDYKSNLIDLENLKKEKSKQNNKKLKDKEQWEKLETQLQDDHKDDVKKLNDTHSAELLSYKTKLEEVTINKDTEIDKMFASLEDQLRDKEIISALALAKGNITVLMPHVLDHVKIIKDDSGEYVARVIDSNGTNRITDSGANMTISDFVTELKEKPEFQGDGLFEKEKQSGGSGSKGNHSNENQDNKDNPFSKDGFNLTQQMKLKKENPTEYNRLKTAAG